jgi:hypothetical protein
MGTLDRKRQRSQEIAVGGRALRARPSRGHLDYIGIQSEEEEEQN